MAHDDQHHHHDHHHGHGHGGTHANQQYFDEQASDYDRKHQKTLDQIIREIRSRLDFLGADWIGEDEENEGPDGKPKRQVRLLDYACGTGVVSRKNQKKALAPYTTQCIGLDLSQGMVDAYNRAAANQGIPPEEMRACAANLLEGDDDDDGPASVSGPEFRDFDVAAVGLGFHHFDDPELAARRLVRRLRPGTGVLFIIDFAPHGAFEKGHPATETVMHHGFSEARIREVFERAGAGKGFGISDMGEVVFWKGEEVMHKRRLFVARGQREDCA